MLPITNIDISKKINRDIKSPIHLGDLSEFANIDRVDFVKFYKPLFSELNWDYYDVKRLQVEFLTNKFPNDKKAIADLFKDYYTKVTELSVYQSWLSKLSESERKDFDAIIPWRRRSVCQFVLSDSSDHIHIKRKAVPQFAQDLKSDDLRSWPRIFDESPKVHVENEKFYRLLLAVFKLVKKVSTIKVKKITVTGHFMSVRALPEQPGDNSPEGAHEDGADFIISALVINRINLKGGESQIIELRDSGEKEIILRHTLQPGEFIFQADSKDELVYGTDLWHHVTPFHMADTNGAEAWRDIIGFDIDIG